MPQPDFPTAQQVHDTWELRKQELLREQAQDLEKVYGSVARFDALGPKKAAQYKMDNWVNTTPTLAVASVGLIAVGALVSPGVAALGIIALGKVALDVIQKGQYNQAVDRYNQLRDGLTAANTPEEGRKHLEAAMPEDSDKKSIPKMLGMIATGAVVGLAACALSPALGVVATTAIGAGAAVMVAKSMGDLFKHESAQDLAESTQKRVKSFAEKLEERRLAAAGPDIDPQVSRPRGP